MTIQNISTQSPSFRFADFQSKFAGFPSKKGWRLFYMATILSYLLFGLSAQALAGNKININEADADTISASVIGIGPVRAQAIVAYRNQFGKFLSLEDILSVPGIGRITLDSIKPFLSLGESDKSALIEMGSPMPVEKQPAVT